MKSSLVRFHFPHGNKSLRDYHLLSFGVLTKKEYLKLPEKVIKNSLPFPFTYICGLIFFFIFFNDKIYGNRLNEDDII